MVFGLTVPTFMSGSRIILLTPRRLPRAQIAWGSVGKLFPHEMLVRVKWSAPQSRSVADLIDWDYLRVLEEVDPDPDWGVAERFERNRPNYYQRAKHKLRGLIA